MSIVASTQVDGTGIALTRAMNLAGYNGAFASDAFDYVAFDVQPEFVPAAITAVDGLSRSGLSFSRSTSVAPASADLGQVSRDGLQITRTRQIAS